MFMKIASILIKIAEANSIILSTASAALLLTS